MKFRTGSLLLTIVALALTVPSNAAEKVLSGTLQRFAALKSLADDWVELGQDGKPTDRLISSIRVTAAGNTVQETLFPGTDHEMVTMYYLDGDDLVLTHYCILGNQPHMRAEPAGDVHSIVFKFVAGTNLKSESAHHMHQATLTIPDKEHYKAEWVSCQEGKPCHCASFNLVRKPRPATRVP